jgi:hypothetical protein
MPKENNSPNLVTVDWSPTLVKIFHRSKWNSKIRLLKFMFLTKHKLNYFTVLGLVPVSYIGTSNFRIYSNSRSSGDDANETTSTPRLTPYTCNFTSNSPTELSDIVEHGVLFFR